MFAGGMITIDIYPLLFLYYYDCVMVLIRCYTCNLVFNVDRPEQRKETIRHSQKCHEITQGFRA